VPGDNFDGPLEDWGPRSGADTGNPMMSGRVFYEADGIEIGVVGRYLAARPDEPAVEVRAFCPSLGIVEDPVTGSLNASLAQWLTGNGTLPPSYVASQGTCLGRSGRVHIERDADTVWVGGDAITCVRGEVLI